MRLPSQPRHIRVLFRFDSLRKGLFSLCFSQAPRDVECTDFSGGAANGGRASIPLAVFWAFAAWTNTAPLEADLAARVDAALKDTVLDKTRIAVAGRDVTFAADAFSEEGRAARSPSVEAVPGVRLVNDDTRLVPEAKPFVWSAERDVVRVTLGGSAPLPASKTGCSRPPAPASAASRSPTRWSSRAARRRASMTPRCCCSIRSAS